MRSTQQNNILTGMAVDKEKVWWYPPDFMQDDGNFVGYEASARMSELARKFPDMIESRRAQEPRDHKYMERRIKWETQGQWIYKLPEEIRFIIMRADDKRNEKI